MLPEDREPESAERWLIAICEAREGARLNLIDDFYYWSRPIIRRAAAALAINSKISEHDGAADIELVVTETFLGLVNDVIAGRKDPAEGNVLFSYLLYRSRARFRQLIRIQAAASVAPMTEALRDLLSDLHLDRPHMARIMHRVSGNTQFTGPFPDVIEALREAERMEDMLHRRDPNWKVTAHPLLDPDLVYVTAAQDARGLHHRSDFEAGSGEDRP